MTWRMIACSVSTPDAVHCWLVGWKMDIFIHLGEEWSNLSSYFFTKYWLKTPTSGFLSGRFTKFCTLFLFSIVRLGWQEACAAFFSPLRVRDAEQLECRGFLWAVLKALRVSFKGLLLHPLTCIFCHQMFDTSHLAKFFTSASHANLVSTENKAWALPNHLCPPEGTIRGPPSVGFFNLSLLPE